MYTGQRELTVGKELKKIHRQEVRLTKKAMKPRPPGTISQLEEKIPEKIQSALESAFCKVFCVLVENEIASDIFTYGIKNHDLLHKFYFQDSDFQLMGKRSALGKMRNSFNTSKYKYLVLSAVEGGGFGTLGIGLPDIAIFSTLLLKSAYEVASRYGFNYRLPEERYFVLKAIQTSVSTGDAWKSGNKELNRIIDGSYSIDTSPESLHRQAAETGKVLAHEILFWKFIQGIPVVGIAGGLSNPVYYQRIINFVHLKYRKRYLCQLIDRK